MFALRNKLPPKVSLKGLQKFASTASELPASFAEYQDETPAVKIDPRKLNKSRLLPQHRNLLHNNVPYQKAESWIHQTEKYQRKIYGQYGAQSNINPSICFDTKQDAELEKERRSFIENKSLQEMMENVRKEARLKLEAKQAREDEIAKKLSKLEQWKTDLNNKIAKKEADALAAKERKERLIEEVRRHFGFKVDPRDERFKELLEQKEKEDKRKQKEAKRKAKEEKMMAKLVEKSSTI